MVKNLSYKSFMEILRTRNLVMTAEEILPWLDIYFGAAVHDVRTARNGLKNILEEHENGGLEHVTFHDLFENECPGYVGQLTRALYKAGKAGAYFLDY